MVIQTETMEKWLEENNGDKAAMWDARASTKDHVAYALSLCEIIYQGLPENYDCEKVVPTQLKEVEILKIYVHFRDCL